MKIDQSLQTLNTIANNLKFMFNTENHPIKWLKINHKYHSNNLRIIKMRPISVREVMDR